VNSEIESYELLYLFANERTSLATCLSDLFNIFIT
jgi:hypothetical protein